MGSFIDITGQKFGRLTAINRAPNSGDRVKWLFKCDCGNQIITDGASAKTGKTRSCGCLNNEMRIKTNTKHGLSSKRIYGIYKSMIQRCHNSSNKKFKIYGGRGIKVCDEWLNDRMTFFEWAFKNGYNDDLTIDRVNGDKGYAPDNCKWATYAEQNRNTTQNFHVMIDGKDKILTDLAKEVGVDRGTLFYRIKKAGMTPEEAISVPIARKTLC